MGLFGIFLIAVIVFPFLIILEQFETRLFEN